MSELDSKIFNQLKMFEDIDRFVLRDNSSKSTLTHTNPDSYKSKKSNDRSVGYGNFDYPLQSNHKRKDDETSSLNLYSNDTSVMYAYDLPRHGINSRYQTSSTSYQNVTKPRGEGMLPKSPSHIGERLTQIGLRVKEKLDLKREKMERSLSAQKTPKISARAQKIIRDPNKFHERLYPSHKLKKNCSTLINNDFDNQTACFNDNSIQSIDRIYRTEKSNNKQIKFNHRPQIDKNSIKLAEKLEPSNIRLLRKKSKPKPQWEPCFKPSNRSVTPNRSKEKCEKLYKDGLERNKQIELTHKKKLAELAKEYKAYPFKPQLVSQSPLANNIGGNVASEHKRENSYDFGVNWKKKLDNKMNKIREHSSKQAESMCPFQPQIRKDKLADDEKFILRNLNQMEDYVNKRRRVLDQKQEQEEYKNKRLGHGDDYQMKVTIPEEFHFETDRNLRRAYKTTLRESRSPENLAMKRENFNTKSFFEDEESSSPEIFNEERKNSNVCLDYYNQNAFLEAVGNLHERIVNLKL